jgi:hypothetical protein
MIEARDLLVVAVGCAAAMAAQAQTPQVKPACERLLPVALVGRVAGEPKAALIPRDPHVGAGGDCNYSADPSAPRKALMLLANINENASHADFARYSGQGRQQAIAGLGDEAVGSETIITARRGRLLVVVSSFFRVNLRTGAATAYFTRAQLIDLVRQALAKG